MGENESSIRSKIHAEIKQLFEFRKRQESFTPGKDFIRYAGAVYDGLEITEMVDALLDGWFSAGKRTKTFEGMLSKYLGVNYSVMTNSGSSANLLAISTLCSKMSKNVLSPGDEVITPASTFPTTLNPVIQNGLTPVFVDSKIGTYNPSVESIENAVSSKTKAIFVPHTLGNPNEMDALVDLAQKNNLFLIEDACDALGSKYKGRLVGTFGDIGTFSFYPAHQITTGEGGAVCCNDDQLSACLLSLRDWGRSCVMPSCNPKTCPDIECPKSLQSSLNMTWEDLPADYDKRYTYTQVGYNLKPADVLASMGIAQLSRLPRFVEARKKNFATLYRELEVYEDYFTLPMATPGSDPCWFAFPLTINNTAPFKRKELLNWLTKNNIEVKLFFTGNILAHPAYKSIPCRLAEKLSNSDEIMKNSFFLGVYPGLDDARLEYITEKMHEFIKKHM